MIPDIFSSFDPYISRTFVPLKTFFLILIPATVLLIILNQFSIRSRIISSYISTLDIIFSQLGRTSSSYIKGLSSLVVSVFILVILLNLMGLTPYSFSSTRHLVTTLSLGLPMWLRLIISRFKFKPKASTAHFLPDGAPD
jgi:F-type H+-transporting ATPase subunit a